jgi:hypothetical protein
VFLPSTSTARLTLEVSPWLALDVTARRALSRDGGEAGLEAGAGEEKWTEEDLQRARSVLGEQFVGVLAMLARRHACREAGGWVCVVDPRGEFALEFENPLARHLQLTASHPRYREAVQGLAGDFRRWIASAPSELGPLGLSELPDDGIVVRCSLPPPVLSPLPD